MEVELKVSPDRLQVICDLLINLDVGGHRQIAQMVSCSMDQMRVRRVFRFSRRRDTTIGVEIGLPDCMNVGVHIVGRPIRDDGETITLLFVHMAYEDRVQLRGWLERLRGSLTRPTRGQSSVIRRSPRAT
jgi:hypothetical protein